jgi:hypothetical protein
VLSDTKFSAVTSFANSALNSSALSLLSLNLCQIFSTPLAIPPYPSIFKCLITEFIELLNLSAYPSANSAFNLSKESFAFTVFFAKFSIIC